MLETGTNTAPARESVGSRTKHSARKKESDKDPCVGEAPMEDRRPDGPKMGRAVLLGTWVSPHVSLSTHGFRLRSPYYR